MWLWHWRSNPCDYGTKAITRLGTPQLLTNSSFPFARSYYIDVSRCVRVNSSLGATCQLGALKTRFGRDFWQCASLCSLRLLLNISMYQSTLFITQQCFRALWNRKHTLVMIRSTYSIWGIMFLHFKAIYLKAEGILLYFVSPRRKYFTYGKQGVFRR